MTRGPLPILGRKNDGQGDALPALTRTHLEVVTCLLIAAGPAHRVNEDFGADVRFRCPYDACLYRSQVRGAGAKLACPFSAAARFS